MANNQHVSAPGSKAHLRGLSSHSWSRLTLAFFVTIPVFMIVTLASTAISSAIDPGSEQFKSAFFAACLTLFLLAAPSTLVCGLLYRGKNKAEIAAGYSTMPFEDESVDVFDFKTGRLLRSSAEPPFTSKDQLRAARAEASH